MQLQKIIIHEIKKERGLNSTELVLSNEMITIDDNSVGLIETLNKSFNSDKVFHAIFDASEGKYFPQKYVDYSSTDRISKNFIKFTKEAIGNLEGTLKTINFATGGYFVFSEYEVNGYNFFSVFLIRDVEGKTLKRTTNSFAIQSIEYVDTKNLAMACRINENRLHQEEKNYLTLTQLKQQDVSDYFKNWISIQQLESSKEYTRELYEIITQIPRPENPETGREYKIETFRHLVYNYISSNPNKLVNVNDLSEHFYNDSDKVADYARNHNISLDTEFRYSSTELKKFIKIEINRDGINLKFSRGTFGKKVKISSENENMILIESQEFAKAFRKETNDAVNRS